MEYNINRMCYKCGEVGHFALHCKAKVGEGMEIRERQKCSRCNKAIDFAVECKKEGVRYNVPKHNARKCPGNGGYDSQRRSDKACFNCKEIGHTYRYCPYDETFCVLCANFGHLGRDCDKKTACYNCGRKDHKIRNCPEESIYCLLCGDYGHISRKCDLNV
ncbi:cellular nucleic acid-binding protein-like [Ctenocephalides felis]|uniref:cellular nucleic acid-binding protein-like n=1 Tax=Ctenocephalides felis TaxID=7515 RepID=UPI000E6E3EAF|nr:cellular nucleic acid-binding protein-like [Ctenocephalides felis]